MKLYTKTGDDGTTGLFGGQRVPKDHPRVAAYGTVDEMNAALGVAASALPETDRRRSIILELQSRAFDLGADLATPPGSPHEDKVPRVEPEDVARLEALIDEVDGGNAPLTSFVLPGGTPAAAQLHLARAICRRAERGVAALAREGAVGHDALLYLNRLGDLLFALARRVNAAADVPDIPWTGRTPD